MGWLLFEFLRHVLCQTKTTFSGVFKKCNLGGRVLPRELYSGRGNYSSSLSTDFNGPVVWKACCSSLCLCGVSGLAIAPRLSRRQQMMQWSVAQVASFYESQDAAAVGATLVSFTIDSIQDDLKLTSFVARKVCKLRDDL